MKIAPAGDRAVLAVVGDVPAAELHGLAAAIRNLPGVVACIAGHSSLYVIFHTAPDVDAIRGARVSSPALPPAAKHLVTVSFRDDDAPDLPELLAAARITRDDLLRRVAALRLVVRYLGFRGGFGYLDGWPPEWSMPRRPTSRPRVAAGTFAAAGAVAGFYPIDSPGGWNLLGRTSHPLEHALTPGDEIVIVPTLAPLEKNGGTPASSPAPPFPLELIASPLSQIVTAPDWSRTLRGLPPGGPFDDVAAAHANRAAGNQAGAPILESALTGPRAVARRDVICSWFGADVEITAGGRPVDDIRQFAVREGEEIRAGRITNGLRGYLAAGPVRGEIEPLLRGDRLEIRAVAGPHESEVRDLVCEVSPQLDRVGIRMRLVAPAGAEAPATLASCGMQCGSVQLHPDGSVVAMGPDHPVTGGYLQPMTVMTSERWKLAQLVPGDIVSFRA
ncbi:MAG TPA: carboxyltransferase domain-containing protein [Thermoanaerobaculia bacterium]|nr:carboxyltransferase domain-containing protein [Thermoanaerobaculia bacterium]